jgi:hypothetical protein
MSPSASLAVELEQLPELIDQLIAEQRLEELRWLVMLFAAPEICGTTMARDALHRAVSTAGLSRFPALAKRVIEFLEEGD